jgi:hypothetical protein
MGGRASSADDPNDSSVVALGIHNREHAAGRRIRDEHDVIGVNGIGKVEAVRVEEAACGFLERAGVDHRCRNASRAVRTEAHRLTQSLTAFREATRPQEPTYPVPDWRRHMHAAAPARLIATARAPAGRGPTRSFFRTPEVTAPPPPPADVTVRADGPFATRLTWATASAIPSAMASACVASAPSRIGCHLRVAITTISLPQRTVDPAVLPMDEKATDTVGADAARRHAHAAREAERELGGVRVE